MKILHLDIGKSYGGIESFIKTFINNTDSSVINYVCAKEGVLFADELKKIGNDKYFSLPFNSFYPKKDFKKINKYCAVNNIDVVQMHGVGAGCLPVFCKKDKRLKYVYTVHGDTDFDRMTCSFLKRVVFKFLENRSMKKSDFVIAVSNDIKNKIIKRGVPSTKIEVIYNSVGAPINKKTLPVNKKERRKFVSIGRLDPVKNYSALIEAFSILPDDYTLDIYGIGDEMDALQSQIIKLNLSNRVRLMGFVEDVKTRIGDYDFYIQSSLYETFGLCLLESMQLFVPVLCTNVGGMKEIVKDGYNGYIIDGLDAKAIASKILKVSNDDNDVAELLKNAYETTKQFSTSVMVNRYIECYERIKKN